MINTILDVKLILLHTRTHFNNFNKNEKFLCNCLFAPNYLLFFAIFHKFKDGVYNNMSFVGRRVIRDLANYSLLICNFYLN